MLFLPLEAHVVERHGWRAVTLLVALVVALLLPLVALLVRDRPSDLGLLPYGASPDTPALVPSRENPLANALRVLRESARKGDFWLLAGSFFVCGASTNGLVGTHHDPGLHGPWHPRGARRGPAGGEGRLRPGGHHRQRLALGSPRLPQAPLLVLRPARAGALWLPQAFDAQVLGLPVFAVFYGLDWIATVPPTVR